MTFTALQMPKDKTYQIRINETLYKQASILAEKKGVSLAELIRFLLLKELDREEAKESGKGS